MKKQMYKVLTSFLLISLAAGLQGQVNLPIDNSYPFIHDNDSYEDVYSAEIVFLMAKAGIIDLQAVIHTNGGWRDPWDDSGFIYEYNMAHAQGLVDMAKRSGFPGIPDPVLGNVNPIIDKPEKSDGAKRIIEIANQSETPVILFAGGPVSTLADAYLMDNNIADKVIVIWLGYKNWNGLADEFKPSVDIVLEHFTCVFFLSYKGYAPVFPKSFFVNLPHTELTQFMVEKELPHVNLPELILLDGLPLVPLLTDEFVTKVNRYDYGGRDENGKVILNENPRGKLYDVVEADPVKGTEAVWNLMNNCSLYGQSPFKTGSTPYHGKPLEIPGKLEAEHFDYGGLGFGYFDTHYKSWSETKNAKVTTFRPVTHVDFKKIGADDDMAYAVSKTQTCEWLNYKIEVPTEGYYDVRAHVRGIDKINHITKEEMASAGIRFLLNGEDVSGIIDVPVGDNSWVDLGKDKIFMTPGVHDFRIYIHRGNMDIDYIEFKQ